MIISHLHRLAFVHIPKCAGTSVRAPLGKLNQWEHAGPPWTRIHPTLGMLDFGHLPLVTLRDFFPTAFNTVRDYWSFAVVRDPFERFASSVSQRLKMYSDQPIHKRGTDEIRAAVDECIDYLSRQPRDNHRLPPEYIHFQKQIDYVELDGDQIVDTLYTVAGVDRLLEDVGKRVGCSVIQRHGEAPPPANRTIVFRNDRLRRVIEIARPLTNRIGRMLPEGLKENVRDRIYVPRDERLKEVFSADHVRDLVRHYYAEDLALFERVRTGVEKKVL